MKTYTGLELITKELLSKDLDFLELCDTVEHLQNCMRTGSWDHITSYLKLLDDTTSVISITCILRSTYSVRDKVEGYRDAVHRCIRILNKRGLDGKSRLRGLYEKD